MKINKNFALRQVAGTWVVLPLAESTLDFNGMLTLNETSVLLWNMLVEGCSKDALVDALTSEYDVGAAQAREDVEVFLEKLNEIGCIE